MAHNCFPKDSRALVRIAEDAGYKFDLLEGVIAVNLEQFDRVAARAVEMVGGSVAGATLAVWGLTFKARTDDLRDSPSLEVIARLRAAGAHIRAYDPSMPDGEVPASKAAVLDGIEVVADPYDACDGRGAAARAHRVGRVPLARHRRPRRPARRAAHPRRAQPPRPRGPGPRGLRLPRHRPAA